MTSTQDIVAKLWSLCHVLRDDGITYHEYVTELTFLLFLKMMKETEQEKLLPAGYRWDDLTAKDGVDQLAFYRSLLVHLGNEGSGRVQAIFANANTSLRQPKNLAKIVGDIDKLDWYSAREEGLGDRDRRYWRLPLVGWDHCPDRSYLKNARDNGPKLQNEAYHNAPTQIQNKTPDSIRTRLRSSSRTHVARDN
jgi:hypothetical protein